MHSHLQDRIKEAAPRAIILSGGPNSVHIPGAPQVPAGFFEYCAAEKIPVLGICYGLHLIVQVHNSPVVPFFHCKPSTVFTAAPLAP